jgi:hypothetical protein
VSLRCVCGVWLRSPTDDFLWHVGMVILKVIKHIVFSVPLDVAGLLLPAQGSEFQQLVLQLRLPLTNNFNFSLRSTGIIQDGETQEVSTCGQHSEWSLMTCVDHRSCL